LVIGDDQVPWNTLFGMWSRIAASELIGIGELARPTRKWQWQVLLYDR
jgi:hypothetical protein